MVSPISQPSGQVAMPPPPLKPEVVFKKIDSTNKGYITESDLAAAIVQFSPEGMNLSKENAKSVAKEAFSKIDANADGKVTSAEFKDAAPKNSPNGRPQQGRPSGPPPGGPPLGGGAGGPTGAQGGTTASASKSTDPADTNQDGTLSETERLAYSSKQQTLAAASNSTTNTKNF